MSQNPESKSRTLKLDVDPSIINKSQLNSSSSKMQYSIPRSNRFSQKRIQFSADKFYDIPDTKTKRSAAFGYGNKLDLAKQSFQRPSPDHYQMKSDFIGDTKKGITISAGREVIKSNSVFQTPKLIPGPGQYNPKNPYIDRPQKSGYSLGGRSVDLTDRWIKSVPGPGNYQTLQLLDKNLKSHNSKIQNVRSGRFPKSKRSSDFDEAIKKRVPGPGQYTKATNDSFTAKFPAKGGCKFSHCERKGIIQSSKMSVPGPGAYQSFSEFLH